MGVCLNTATTVLESNVVEVFQDTRGSIPAHSWQYARTPVAVFKLTQDQKHGDRDRQAAEQDAQAQAADLTATQEQQTPTLAPGRNGDVFSVVRDRLSAAIVDAPR
jgi:hypothetical protein